MRTKLQRVRAKKYYSPIARKKYKQQKQKVLTPQEPYRSWLEADVAKALHMVSVKFEYEPFKIHYVIPAQAHTYTPDFELDNGIIVETKGRWTSADRKKMGLVIEQNPEMDIRMLFALDNKISPNSRTKYSTWCEKRDIKYAIGAEVPQEWINE